MRGGDNLYSDCGCARSDTGNVEVVLPINSNRRVGLRLRASPVLADLNWRGKGGDGMCGDIATAVLRATAEDWRVLLGKPFVNKPEAKGPRRTASREGSGHEPEHLPARTSSPDCGRDALVRAFLQSAKKKGGTGLFYLTAWESFSHQVFSWDQESPRKIVHGAWRRATFLATASRPSSVGPRLGLRCRQALIR